MKQDDRKKKENITKNMDYSKKNENKQNENKKSILTLKTDFIRQIEGRGYE